MQQYEQHIEPDAPQAQVPEELHPVAAAFGGDIGAALEKTGEQVQNRIEQLTQHMARMNYYRGQQAKQDLITKMDTIKQDLIFNNKDSVEIPKQSGAKDLDHSTASLTLGTPQSGTSPEQMITLPGAIINQKGNLAHYSLDFYDAQMTKAKDQIIQEARDQGLGERNIKSLVIGLDHSWVSGRSFVSSHQAEQLNQAQQKSFLTSMQVKADGAVTSLDPVSLGRTIDGIKEANKNLNDAQQVPALNADGTPNDTRQKTEDKFVGDAVMNSTKTLLKATGNQDQAQGLIDKLHDDGKINNTVWQKTKTFIDNTYQQDQQKLNRAATSQMVNNRLSIISQLASNKIDLSNADQMATDIGIYDPELGTAIKTAASSKSWGHISAYTPTDEKNQAFSDISQSIFKAKNQKEISDFIVRAVHSTANGEMSQDRLNILVSAAMIRSQGIPVGSKYDVSTNFNDKTKAIDNAATSLEQWQQKTENKNQNLWTRFMNMIGQNKDPQIAHDEAIKQTQQDNNPVSVKYKIGDQITNSKTGDIGEVIGLNDRGVPLIRVKKGGRPKPERKPESEQQ